jgi:hypothetical protein
MKEAAARRERARRVYSVECMEKSGVGGEDGAVNGVVSVKVERQRQRSGRGLVHITTPAGPVYTVVRGPGGGCGVPMQPIPALCSAADTAGWHRSSLTAPVAACRRSTDRWPAPERRLFRLVAATHRRECSARAQNGSPPSACIARVGASDCARALQGCTSRTTHGHARRKRTDDSRLALVSCPRRRFTQPASRLTPRRATATQSE